MLKKLSWLLCVCALSVWAQDDEFSEDFSAATETVEETTVDGAAEEGVAEENSAISEEEQPPTKSLNTLFSKSESVLFISSLSFSRLISSKPCAAPRRTSEASCINSSALRSLALLRTPNARKILSCHDIL